MTNRVESMSLQPGTLKPRDLEEHLERARQRNIPLVDLILEERRISEDALADALAEWLKLPRIRLATVSVDPEAAKSINQELALKHLCLPISLEGNTLVVAMANPADYAAMQDVQFAAGRAVRPVVATKTEILDAIEEVYATGQRMQDFLANVADASDFQILGQEIDQMDLDGMDTRSAAELAPVVKMCNLIVKEAIKARASDIHIEPGLNSVQVRLRVDGVLREFMDVPKWLHNPVVSRLKILAKLDIAERRVPQDGRIKVQFQSAQADIRISTLPTHFGEKVVLRILGTSKLPDLAEIGMDEALIPVVEKNLNQPQGMILVTGPTGSGKSTTLYSMILKRQTPEVNIVTVEDPIEYQLRGINQVQVNVKTGLTFANCLRSILRQDPDVILVGEIRDLETAEIAFQASMTGHLVLSTLHTNSALMAITRLLDLGLDPFLILSSVNLIIAQRLARRICHRCSEPYIPTTALLERLRIDDLSFTHYRGRGCSACGNTGYAGRIGIFEVLRMTPTLKELIRRKASENEMKKAAVSAGMRFLLEDALLKVRAGLTNLEELARVLEIQEEDTIRCPSCSCLIDLNFSTCPYCLYTLRTFCKSCGQELKADWKVCPYCNTRFTLTTPEEPRKGLPSPTPQEPRGEIVLRQATPALADTPQLKRPRILVVDDDESIQKVVRKALRQLPVEAEIHTASDGQEALDIIDDRTIDLIILDISMPRVNGFAVCKSLRENIRTAFLPIMMLTANSDEESRTRGYLVGTDDYVTKPFSVIDLNARVMRLLRRTYGI